MNKYLFFLLAMMCSVSEAHVYPGLVDIYSHEDLTEEQIKQIKLPERELFYIRITPSPVMEGFASYEFCPYIYGPNRKKYLSENYVKQHGQESLNYHQDLVNKDCVRPYGMNPLGDKVYFDIRAIDRILKQDEGLFFGKELGMLGGSLALMRANPWVLGISIVVGYGIEFVEDYWDKGFDPGQESLLAGVDASFGMIPDEFKEQIMFKITRGDYFAGKQVRDGMDLKWPILPDNYTRIAKTPDGIEYEQKLQMYDACYKECMQDNSMEERQAELDRQNEVEEKLRRENNPLHIESLTLEPTESITQMYSIDPWNKGTRCSSRCDGMPRHRTSMKNIWKELYLNTIYKAGHIPTATGKPMTDELALQMQQDKSTLFKVYDENKRFDLSRWELARDKNGKQIPNHYVNRWYLPLSTTAHRLPARHIQLPLDAVKPPQELCDLKRFKAYYEYSHHNKILVPKDNMVGFAEWTRDQCHFSEDDSCREYLHGPIQRGDEICTIVSEYHWDLLDP